MIRRYLPFVMRGVEPNTYIVNEEFETEDGAPAWIRLKVVNNGEAFNLHHQNYPLIVLGKVQHILVVCVCLSVCLCVSVCVCVFIFFFFFPMIDLRCC